ncbi:hydrogenase accessory protein HypB, partial [bacterium]
CHLDAELVHRALHGLPWKDLDLLFIENVGNLVCPAVYDLGQAANVVVLSVTEGEDKPLKYPVMFRKADLVLLTKTDLLPHMPEVRVEVILDNLARVMPDPQAILLSARTGEGLELWLDWLEAGRSRTASEARRRGDLAPPSGIDYSVVPPSQAPSVQKSTSQLAKQEFE